MNNIQVTFDRDVNNARSESSIVINPNNPQQIVAGSKKFRDIHTYDFTLATVYSTNGGLSWQDSDDLPMPGFNLLTDPALTWDDVGNVYLVGLSGTLGYVPNSTETRFNTIGIEVYNSVNGGKTWSNPRRIHASPADDKQWAAGDNNRHSPHHGNIYVVWDDGSDMRFARSKDHGATWIGAGTGVTAAGTVLFNGSLAPEINVAEDGMIYIVWIRGANIHMLVSNDGGDSFHQVTSPASSITTIGMKFSGANGWTTMPGGNFRVLTLPTACISGQMVVVAWADARDTINLSNPKSRIYYALSHDGGSTWLTGASGQPMLSDAVPDDLQHFHPQVVVDPRGVIGCAFYEFGPKAPPGGGAAVPMIDVIMTMSFTGGVSPPAYYPGTHYPIPMSRSGYPFEPRVTVTSQPWDPAVDAPWSHGIPNVTFIGDYFGLDASVNGFYPLWTDTRTGIQELWTAIVPAPLPTPSHTYGQVAQILFGIIQDGGGFEIVGGHIRHIPPYGPPELDILLGVATHRIAALVASKEGVALQKAAMNMVVKVAQQEIKRLDKKE